MGELIWFALLKSWWAPKRWMSERIDERAVSFSAAEEERIMRLLFSRFLLWWVMGCTAANGSAQRRQQQQAIHPPHQQATPFDWTKRKSNWELLWLELICFSFSSPFHLPRWWVRAMKGESGRKGATASALWAHITHKAIPSNFIHQLRCVDGMKSLIGVALSLLTWLKRYYNSTVVDQWIIKLP